MTPDPTHGPALQVLLVEDDKVGANLLADLLRTRGFEVRIAADGPEALAAARHEHPDVVLLDIGLPGLDGFEVGRRMKGLRMEKRPLVVAVTGSDAPGDRRRSEESGIDLHLRKPVNPVGLLDLLERFQRVIL